MKHDYAQTILQLLAQLQASGHPLSDLVRVRRAADFANLLFGAMARGSGKPFSAHLIGTASILARYGAAPPLVSAAILHAAYAQGRWGDGAIGATPAHRQALRDVLGQVAEDIVCRYTEFKWRQPGAVAEHAKSHRQGDGSNLDLVLMRLANELEEYLDSGNLYAPDAADRKQFARIYGDYMIELARSARVPGLGAELTIAFATYETMQCPQSLHSLGPEGCAGARDAADAQHDGAERLGLVDYVARHAREQPQALAIEHRAGGLTWAALLSRVRGLARAIDAGGSVERPVAALLRQANMPIALLATLQSGRVFAPIATDYPAARRRRILGELAAGCLLVDDDTARHVTDCACPVVNVDRTDALASGWIPALRSDLAAPALVIFTSGSTGEPLGVVHSEDSLLRLAQRSIRAFEIGRSDRISMLSSGVHISGITDMIRSFVSAAALVLCDVAASGIDAAVDAVRDADVTVLHCTPSLATALFGALAEEECFSTVRLVHLGGETLTSDVVALCRRHLPATAVVVNQLGCTELSGFCQAYYSAETALPPTFAAAGYPVDGVTVRILDAHGEPAAVGHTGHIEVSGEGLALAYWNAPDRTSAVFREPAAGACRHFLTGDRGRWLPDGQLEHQGRIDRQVQVRGFRVELAEIENALLQLDMIADAAVVAPASKTDVRVVAHVVPASGRIDRTELHALLSTTLPASMLPHHYVVHESLPRTSTGKVDRIALATVVPEAGAGRGDSASTPGAVPPERGNEKSVSIIVAVCAQVLGVESIREDDNFFLLGGDSLQAMRVASRLAVRLRADVRVRDFLEAPTPRQLAERLASAGRAMPEPAAPDERLQALLSEIETLPLDEVRRRLGA